jgi:hypothetical protein
MVQKMSHDRMSRRARRLSSVLAAALACAPCAARAQDSFVREADFLTGRPVLSVLGAGVGQRPAALVLEVACPGAGLWSLDLHGADFPAGAPITLDLGDARRGWQEVRLVSVQRPDADRLRIGVDEASLRAALAWAGAAAPGAQGAAVLQVGSELGMAVGLDGLAREIGRLAQDCAAPRSAGLRAGTPVAGYAR